MVTSGTGFAVAAEIEAATDPHRFRFDVSIPETATLFLTDTGSVDVIRSDGVTIGTFEAPWAVDANGSKVETSYSIDGTAIVQTVAASDPALYPVVADPKYTWGWVTGTVYFKKWETNYICTAGIGGIYWIVTSGFWLPLLLTMAAVVVPMACLASILDKCIKFKSTLSTTIYSGGYCT